MTARICTLVLLLLVGVAGDALAGDPLAVPTEPQAVAHWKKATKALDANNYDVAIEEYRAGARVEDLPFWDWNLANTYKKAGRPKLARWYFDRYISRLESESSTDAEVKGAIEAARIHLAEMDEAERAQPERVEPSVVRAGGAGPDRTSRWTTQRKIAIGVAALGVAAAGTGAWFGIEGDSLHSDAAAACPPGCTIAEAEEANRIADRADSHVRRANILFGGAAIAVLGATVLWFTGGPSGSSSKAAIAPTFSPTHAGVGIVGRF